MSDEKKQKIKIYGASDDLIEIEGDINEEFSAFLDENGHIAISDGSLIKVFYNGEWFFNVLKKGLCTIIKRGILDKDNEQEYSEELLLEGKIDWIVYGNSMAAIK